MDKEFKQFLSSLRFPLLAVCLLWIVKFYEIISQTSLGRFGIFPRALDGLIGILTSPFIHGSWHHLISNTFPILILTTLMIHFFSKVAIRAYVFITLLTGFLIWLFGRQSYHIGASGVVYGLITFVFAIGIIRRDTRSMALAFLVFTLYSGYLEGFVPKQGISHEAHIFGALSGALFAYLVRNVREEGEALPKTNREVKQKSYFLPRDIFEKTKQERWLEQQAMLEQQRLEREERARLWREANGLNGN
jgi:membrane associated rhomboid family serine protease